jgi:oxygen-dependent protoporphyrinogen oxidase
VRVAVVGAGISGLTTAFYLLKEGANVTVLEKLPRPGGKIRTVKDRGFIVEQGPNGFLDSKPSTVSLVADLSIKDSLYPSSDAVRLRFLCLGGKLVKVPESPLSFLFSPVLSVRGKLRLLAEPFVPPKRDGLDESVSEFVRRRIGGEALEKLIDPMVAGIFAGNPDVLSMKSAFPTLYELERQYGSLVKAMVKRRGGSGPAGPAGRLTSFKGGMEELILALSSALSGALLTQAQVINLSKERNRWKVTFKRDGREVEEEFDAVVLSTPAYVSARLLEDIESEASHLLSQIDYPPISVVALTFDRRNLGHDLKGFGFLVPRREGRSILGALWDSSVFPNRAPEGKALLRVMIGGARQPSLALLPEDSLAEIAMSELREIMNLKSEPESVLVFKHEKGIPHYTIGHSERVERVFQLLKKHKGLFLCNNAYTGIGVNDCTRAGMETAKAVLGSF